jgi:membrane protein
VEGVSFEQVSDPDMADFTLSIASPPMVDTLCAPLQTISMWNCRNGDNVVLNSDRWSYGSPTFPDVDSYRIYVINHEVGHFLGHEHEFCAGPGLKSPTMAQQSRTREGGCTANGWPTQDNQAS